MLIVVVCVFSCCVVPLDLYQTIIYTLFKLHVDIGKNEYAFITIANTFITKLQIENSATNIIIYSRMLRDFA